MLVFVWPDNTQISFCPTADCESNFNSEIPRHQSLPLNKTLSAQSSAP